MTTKCKLSGILEQKDIREKQEIPIKYEMWLMFQYWFIKYTNISYNGEIGVGYTGTLIFAVFPESKTRKSLFLEK